MVLGTDQGLIPVSQHKSGHHKMLTVQSGSVLYALTDVQVFAVVVSRSGNHHAFLSMLAWSCLSFILLQLKNQAVARREGTVLPVC